MLNNPNRKRAHLMMRNIIAAFMFTATAAHADNRALELSYLEPIIAADIIEYTNLEVPALENIEIIEDHLILRMFPDQPKVNNGNRAEISVDFPFSAGDTITYQWRLRIPEGSETDPQNRWWNIAQWHDQPNLNIGETWDDFPSRSPSIAIGYIALDGADYIGLSYGLPDRRNSDPIPFSRGVWHTLRLEIHWSEGADGYAHVYWDNGDTPIAIGTGSNMHNDFQHYLKLGTYRHPDIRITSEIHIDDVAIWLAD